MTEWIVATIDQLGYFCLFLLVPLESVFPPIPSEVIVPFAGFAAARGGLTLPRVLAATTLGSVAGMLPWYFLGRIFGLERICSLADRFGRWFTINAEEVRKATGYFDRYGPLIVLVGRLAPIIRTLISVPAGLARMGLPRFLAGYCLQDNYELVGSWIDPLTIAVLIAVIALYPYRLVTRRPEASR